jgi:predicted acyl esterase
MDANLSPMRSLIVALVMLASANATASPPDQVGPGYDIEMGRMIPMRDGVSLEAWITKPSHLAGKAPAVLELTQYDIDGGTRGEPAIRL